MTLKVIQGHKQWTLLVVCARLEMVWLEQPNKFGQLIWLPNLVAVNKHFSNYSVISNCEWVYTTHNKNTELACIPKLF